MLSLCDVPVWTQEIRPVGGLRHTAVPAIKSPRIEENLSLLHVRPF